MSLSGQAVCSPGTGQVTDFLSGLQTAHIGKDIVSVTKFLSHDLL